MNMVWSIHTLEYYSALKRKDSVTPATTWMDLEDIMLSETSQSQKDRSCVIPLESGSQRQEVEGGGGSGEGP